MENSILLTIGIPTYNGSKYIEQTLESILMQLDIFDFKEIEILISDNGSIDSTQDIIKAYSKKYPNLISYYRNEKNIGYDRNVDMIFKKAKGEYVETLGDDDFYKDEFCLEKILKIIKSDREISVILLPIDFLDTDTNKIIKGFRINKDFIFKNGDDFFSTTKWSTSAVSSLIIKKEFWNKVEKEKYFGSQWIHIGVLINILKSKRKAYVISEPLIVVRVKNSRWGEHFGNQLECGFNHLNLFSEMISLGYRKETFEIFLKDRYKHNIEDILILKPKKYRERIAITKLMIKFFKNYPLFWILHIPAMFFPSFLTHSILFIKKIINKFKICTIAFQEK